MKRAKNILAIFVITFMFLSFFNIAKADSHLVNIINKSEEFDLTGKKIDIIKVDDDNDISEYIRLYKEDRLDVYKSIIADSNNLQIQLESGKYFITEEKNDDLLKLSPFFLNVDDTTDKVEIKHYEDIPKPEGDINIKIHKHDENNDALENVEFVFYEAIKSDEYEKLDQKTKSFFKKEFISNEEFYIAKLSVNDKNVYYSNENTVLFTDKNGDIIINNLKKSNYLAKEVKALDGYRLDDSYILLNEDNSYYEDVVNQKEPKKSSLRIIKIDSKTKQRLKNAEFSLKKEDNDKLTEVTSNRITDDNGEIFYENLDLGVYYLEEIKTPDHADVKYKKMNGTRKIVLDEENTIKTVEIANARVENKIPNVNDKDKKAPKKSNKSPNTGVSFPLSILIILIVAIISLMILNKNKRSSERSGGIK
ncbi:MAG: prealbumin-like fold domain-containing protein [Tissierellia bacterium]|nr:prealbumin-like fold domain-containing protein [Tissierellia bacterium]